MAPVINVLPEPTAAPCSPKPALPTRHECAPAKA
jgi:hypothetical protein